jgi:hypothetical protein
MLPLGTLSQSSPPPRGFTTRWTVAGGVTARSINLPLLPTRTEGSLAYNCTVNWGDGSPLATVTSWNDPSANHTYAVDGTYDVEVRGICEGWSVNFYTSLALKITGLLSWGDPSLFGGFKYLAAGFAGCSNLTTLPTGSILASDGGVGVQGFQSTFSKCSITSVPPNLFMYHPNVTTFAFKACFSPCPLLTSVPAGLFRYATLASTDAFSGAFTQCTSLSVIPPGIFQYNTLVSGAAFLNVFQQTSVTSVPVDLFRYNSLVSANGFRQAFYQCTSLASVPTDIFRYNTSVSTDGFRSCFFGCTSLASIPVDLFRYNTAVSGAGFRSTFNGCSSLANVPADLFRYNLNVGSLGFSYTFLDCVKLQLNRNIFYADGEQASRFVDRPSDFTNCFNRTAFTGTPGEAPDLWNCNFGTATPVKLLCFGGTGNSPASVSNYGDIPAAWIT